MKLNNNATYALMVLGFFGLFGYELYTVSQEKLAKNTLEQARVEKGYVLQEGYLNKNFQKDTFYVIGNDTIPVSIDGQKATDFVRVYKPK